MGQQSDGNNNQVFAGVGIALLIAGVGYWAMNASSAPQLNSQPVQQVQPVQPAVAAAPTQTELAMRADQPVRVQGPARDSGSPSALNPAAMSNEQLDGLSQQQKIDLAMSPNTPVGMNLGLGRDKKFQSTVTGADSELGLTDLTERVEPAIVRITTSSADGDSVGNGYVVSDDGLVVTNYHVIEGARSATVEFADGTKSDVLGFKHYDTSYDIAIIQIEPPAQGLSPVPLNDEIPTAGVSIVAFGASPGSPFTATPGTISAIRNSEQIREQTGLELQGTWLETSTPISPDTTGGPLVDLWGRVVAMNTLHFPTAQNSNFAISASDVLGQLDLAISQPLQEFKPGNLPEIDRSTKHRLAKDLSGIDRGMELLATTDKIGLVLDVRPSDFDSTGQMKNAVQSVVERAVERTGIQMLPGEASEPACLMTVTLFAKSVTNGRPGTQELFVEAFLVCQDRDQPGRNKLVKIWTLEETAIGTIAPQALAAGQLPRSVNSNLSRVFNKFRSAHSRAKRESQ